MALRIPALQQPKAKLRSLQQLWTRFQPVLLCRVQSIYNLFGNACDKQTYSGVHEVVQSEMQEVKSALALLPQGGWEGAEWGASPSLSRLESLTLICAQTGAASAVGTTTDFLSEHSKFW